jgi:hypothetical protein
MKSEKNIRNNAMMTIRVIVAAAQRGIAYLPMCFVLSQRTNGRPMMASTADTSMYITTELKYHIKNSIPAVITKPTQKRSMFCGVTAILH